MVEANWDEGMKKEVPDRWLRSVAGRCRGCWRRWAVTRRMDGRGGGDLRERLKNASRWKRRRLESMVFLNRGEDGRAEPPREAQWSPGYGVSVGDVDGDGKEDGAEPEFFGVNGEMSRCDGGEGWC